MTTPVDATHAFIPLSMLAILICPSALAGSIQLMRARTPRWGTLLWLCLPGALLIALSSFLATGTVDTTIDIESLYLYSAGIACTGLVMLLRGPVIDWFGTLQGPARTSLTLLRDMVILGVCTLIGAWLLDFVWLSEASKIQLGYYTMTVIVVAACFVFTYVVGQRTGFLCTLVLIACFALSIAQFFVLEFKNAALLPSDLLTLETAAAVGNKYTLMFNIRMLHGMLACSCGFSLLSFIWPSYPKTLRFISMHTVCNIILALCIGQGLLSVYHSVSLEKDYGLSYDRWMPITTYKNTGILPGFLAMLQDFAILKPDAYSAQHAQTIETKLAEQYDALWDANPTTQEARTQFEAVKPAIVTIMNESFTDLSLYPAVAEAGYTGPEQYNAIPDALMRGTLMASVQGGGTANSEFEYLTGTATAFVGYGKIAYQIYNFSHVNSLAKQLGALGYKTTAIHPENPHNYNRSSVYPMLGFNRFLSWEDFKDAPVYHHGVTDASTYQRILDILRTDPNPQFILDVTMQNHGGYGAGTVPDQELPGVYPAGVDDPEVLTNLNTYLACVNASDRDLAWFIEELRNLDRPVILVFFGDHQPSVGYSINEITHAEGDDELAHIQRNHMSTYLVWANYDVAGQEQQSEHQDMGIWTLGAEVLHLAGAPLTPYQKAQLAARQEISSLNMFGYTGADGTLYPLNSKESPYASLVEDLRRVSYLEFAEKTR
ncbi:LTA synthase family protein [Collinsella sp. zg1085]|uniref:LTA synthase family protein n=1 Tax=Collinsella sp. zg1085 TaxID=2844380 RepID=UPI001C0C3F3A|nr:LTA synthase family protein [Collinsella sp. zg1085]QWT17230.1 LTA synthase family protein [Collinsella sp. zg1085]